MRHLVPFLLLLGALAPAGAQPPTGGAATQAGLTLYPLTVTKSGTGLGTITGAGPINCGSQCGASYVAGVSVVLAASPTAGSTFSGWSGGGCGGTGTCTVTMSAAQSVSAGFALSGATANRFASHGGLTSGTCATSGTACRLDYLLGSVLTCGDTVQLNNGTYTSAANMLVVNTTTTPSGARSCSAGSQVTVQAETEGSVLFDRANTGDWAVLLRDVAYWTVTGINIKRGWTNLEVRDSSHVTLQRIVAYDGANVTGNIQIVLVYHSSDVLVEDVAAFGNGVQAILEYTPQGGVTWRRVWARTEGTSNTGDTATANQFNYNSNVISTTPSLAENLIQTSAAPRFTAGSLGYVTNWVRDDAQSPYMRFYGGFHYAHTGHASYISTNGHPEACSGYLVQDTVVLARGSNTKPIEVGDGSDGYCDAGSSPQQQQWTRVNAITGGTGAASTFGPANKTNFVEATTVGGTGFDYLGTGNTAKLCYRYVDGTYTSTPLWPWPMDDRIKAAIAENSGGFGGASPTLAGSAGTGYAANTVTSEVVSLLGSIPTSCNGSALRLHRLELRGLGLLYLLIAGTAVARRQRNAYALRS